MADPFAVAAVLKEIGFEDIYIDGDEVHARCWPHEERTGEREHRPRHWSINATTGKYNCFSCHWSGGSLTKLVMEVKGCGLWEASRLINDHQVVFDHQNDFDRQSDRPQNPEQYYGKVRAIFDEEFWSEIPDELLRDRQVSQSACRDYEVRYLAEWKPERMLPDKTLTKAKWVECWVLPIFDRHSTLHGWQCKPQDGHPWIEPSTELPDGTVECHVHKSEHLFGFDRLNIGQVILVESPLDCVYLHAIGYPFSAVAAFGAHPSDHQMNLLVNSYATSLIVALDNDQAGWDGTRSLIERGWHKKIPTFLFNYGTALGTDPGELSPTEIEYGLKNAQLVSKGRRRRAS